VALLAAAFGRVDTAAAQQPKPTAATTQASAQSNEARAQELFKKSLESYRRGDFKQSIDLLQEAYTLHPDPVLLYNLGRAYDGIGDRAAARDAYTRYVHDDPNAQDRGAIEQRIATLQRELDERAALEKQRDDERLRREQDEQDRKKKEDERRAKEADEKNHVAEKKHSVLPYVVMGVGAAGLVTGGVFGVLSGSAHSDAQKDAVQTKAIDDQSRAHTFADVANVSFVAGGVLLVGGAVWWFVDSRSSDKPQTARIVPAFGPGAIGAVGTF
jgi:tetratricopeptide (TPR) repeat protein